MERAIAPRRVVVLQGEVAVRAAGWRRPSGSAARRPAGRPAAAPRAAASVQGEHAREGRPAVPHAGGAGQRHRRATARASASSGPPVSARDVRAADPRRAMSDEQRDQAEPQSSRAQRRRPSASAADAGRRSRAPIRRRRARRGGCRAGDDAAPAQAAAAARRPDREPGPIPARASPGGLTARHCTWPRRTAD